jgi:predicted DsbA family dithiol-disulfide isomerase
VGKRRFEVALAQLPGRDRERVVVRRRSFELDPGAPREKNPGRAYADRLARKYATSRGKAEEMIRTMTAAGAGEGLELRFDRIRPGNTHDAHRILHLAAAEGLDAELEERLFRAYLTEGEPIGDPATLARLAADVDLDARAVLESDRYADAVRADEAEAARRGIHGVPFFRVADRFALSGAQPPELLLRALRAAADELDAESGAAGGACGPAGCD